MTSRFETLYAAKPFDPSNRQDQIGEAARIALLDAVVNSTATHQIEDGGDMPYLIGGLLVGVVQVMQAVAGSSDEVSASIRASIIQIAPWAVDMARSCDGREPLYSETAP